jgi:uncharacterized protein (TIGR03437 family)
VVYANGLGATGTLTPLPVIKVGGIAANVRYAGQISPGLYQINFDIPTGLPSGDNALSATVNGSTTQTGVLITLQ